MVGVLDEAANVCRWRELPNLYSHYGSRCIVLMIILQSWSQGVEVWGRDGTRKLWSASNIKVYGGGVAEKNAHWKCRTWPRSLVAAPSCSPPAPPAALLETVPWMSGPQADAVRASITAHDPANRPAAAAASRWIAAGAANE